MAITIEKKSNGSIKIVEDSKTVYLNNLQNVNIEAIGPSDDSPFIYIKYDGGECILPLNQITKINGANKPSSLTATLDLLATEVFNFGGGTGEGGTETGLAVIKNYWEGKNIMVIGDSYFADNYVTPYLKDNLDANFINKSVGNTTITPGYKNPGLSFWDRVQTAGYISSSTPDLVVIWGTVNEPFGQTNGSPVPIGTIGDSETGTPTTFYGALKQLVLKVMSQAPNARILLTTNVIILAEGGRGTYSTQKGYRDAIIAVGERYSIPVLDLQKESGFTFETNATWLLADQVHPTPTGGKLLARMLINKIKEL